MSNKHLPTIEYLRQRLRYCSDTGKLFWHYKNLNDFADRQHGQIWNSRFAGNEAGTINKKGYRKIKLDGSVYLAHRLCWAIHFGEYPSSQIDHINGCPGDNRISNMRVVTNAENCKNKSKSKYNTSGIVGVSWRDDIKKWRAQIKVNQKIISLGHYEHFDDAVEMRKSAEIKYSFHQNHGRQKPF